MNLGLIKYYFGTKEQLWRAAVDRGGGRAPGGARRRRPRRDRDAGRDLVELLRVCVRFAARNPAFIRVMNDEGKRDGPRMRWLVDRHGRPLYEPAARGLRARAGEAARSPTSTPVHLYYMLIGAIGMIFSQAPECRRITGVDPTASEAVIEAHAEAVARLVLEPAER